MENNYETMERLKDIIHEAPRDQLEAKRYAIVKGLTYLPFDIIADKLDFSGEYRLILPKTFRAPSRKRFIKLMMAVGMCRDSARDLAYEAAKINQFDYTSAFVKCCNISTQAAKAAKAEEKAEGEES